MLTFLFNNYNEFTGNPKLINLPFCLKQNTKSDTFSINCSKLTTYSKTKIFNNSNIADVLFKVFKI